MDEIDRRIIVLLADDARMSATALAAQLPLSLSATTERLRRLTASGVIRRYTVELGDEATGRQIDALVDVRLGGARDKATADAAVRQMAAVVDACHVTGRYDYVLRVAARSVAHLDEVVGALTAELDAAETNTRLVLRTLTDFPRHPPLA
ncbi:MAG: Lrp/AsnC family transcriptional regulator [Actinomycetota bacterium]|nr:Lrp/AsnC family transcriptional regulator [Actinomycetota bacterium]